jgi:Uma2 family endonuclease
MATATAESDSVSGEGYFVLDGIDYDGYVAINDAINEGRNIRVVYVDGRVTFLTASRRHEWFSRRLADLVKAVASATGIRWEDAGSATYRRSDQKVGVEGDETFYLGAHAELMRGSINIDLSSQPPPDIAIEVEVSHPADDALLVYGRLGVPEVWRFDVEDWTFSFCLRREDGSYERSSRGSALPWLGATDILDQLRLAEALGANEWSIQLSEWVRTTIVPRMTEG